MHLGLFIGHHAFASRQLRGEHSNSIIDFAARFFCVDRDDSIGRIVDFLDGEGDIHIKRLRGINQPLGVLP